MIHHFEAFFSVFSQVHLAKRKIADGLCNRLIDKTWMTPVLTEKGGEAAYQPQS
jgi:hypothetical protein